MWWKLPVICACCSAAGVPRTEGVLVTQLLPRVGLKEALLWCDSGLLGGLTKTIQGFLTGIGKTQRVYQISHAFDAQFNADTGVLYLTPDELEDLYRSCHFSSGTKASWTSLVEESYHRGYSPSYEALEEILGADVINGMCRSLAPLDQSLYDQVVGNTTLIYDAFHTVLLASTQNPVVLSDQGVFAGFSLFPIIRRILNLPRTARSLEQKLNYLGDVLCRISDLESMIFPLNGDNGISCSVVDLIYSIVGCTSALNTNEFYNSTSLGAIEKNWALFVANDDKMCFAPKSSLQAKSDKRLRVFDWTDPTLYLPLSMQDVRPTPMVIPAEVRQSEMLTYLALWRASMGQYALMSEKAAELAGRQLVPGWEINTTIFIDYPTLVDYDGSGRIGTARIPAISVSKNNEMKCEYLIVAKGTTHTIEWALDFNYWSVPTSDYSQGAESRKLDERRIEFGGENSFSRRSQRFKSKYPESPHVSGVHAGIQTILATVVEPIERVLGKMAEADQCDLCQGRVIFSGHSLGGGVAVLLANHFGLKYTRAECNLRVDMVSFAAPRVLSGLPLTDNYRRTVNARSLIDKGDFLYHVPCYKRNSLAGFKRCDSRHSNIPGTGGDIYEDNPGMVLLRVMKAKDHPHDGRLFPEATEYFDDSIDDSQEQAEARAVRFTRSSGASSTNSAGGVERLPQALFNVTAAYITSLSIESQQLIKGTEHTTSSILSRPLELFFQHILGLPNMLFDTFPKQWELVSSHFASYSCAVSGGCRGSPAAAYTWMCEDADRLTH